MALLYGIDFETWAPRSIKEVGLDNYVKQDGFQVLLGALTVRTLPSSYILGTYCYDFVHEDSFEYLQEQLDYSYPGREKTRRYLVAHNAEFEIAVLNHLGINIDNFEVVDSAAVARWAGASSSLESAAHQLLDEHKHPEGQRLVKKFSLSPTPPTVGSLAADAVDWEAFTRYCIQDAKLSLDLIMQRGAFQEYLLQEQHYSTLTSKMNQQGWRVDLDMVRSMQELAERNREQRLKDFREVHDRNGKLNLNSLKQMKEWCRARGIKAESFNEENVAKLIDRIQKKIVEIQDDDSVPVATTNNYIEVLEMLQVKKAMGGSSLSKLHQILERTGPDGRLRHQYLHIGAGQTARTSGTGVQMQNLKRMGSGRHDVETLLDEDDSWTNDELASNLRQVFTSSHPNGFLIVGDFSSVESRGLAWLAGEQWKLDAYFQSKDMYKVMASKFFNVDYLQINKEQRQAGKVGELGCGYGAGAGALVSFAKKIGMELTLPAAEEVVRNWRDSNPKIVALWNLLDEALHKAVSSASYGEVNIGAIKIHLASVSAPASLAKQHPGCLSVRVDLYYKDQWIMRRMIHGVYLRGCDVCYYKPSSNVTGDSWSAWYMNPKTKQRTWYKMYGGKLAGILTQSFCRELFFRAMARADRNLSQYGVPIIGQFHDELVLDWTPNAKISLTKAVSGLQQAMSEDPIFSSFPLAAEIKYDYRYTK